MGYIRKKVNLKMTRNVILFIGLIALTFFIIFKDQDVGELYKVILSADKEFVLLAIGLMLVYFLIESYNIKSTLRVLGNKVSIFAALRYTFIGFFFSAITPAATGGQPVESYYMTKDKISGGDAAMTLLLQLCGFQISTIVLGVVCAIINPSVLSGGLIWFFILGLVINGFALTMMLIFVFSKTMTEKLLNITYKALTFFKAKNIELRKKTVFEAVEKYKNGSIFIKTHKLVFIKSVLRVFVQILVYYSIPFCVYKAFGLDTYSYIQFLPLQAVLYTIVSGIPLPGAVGISEYVFLTIFGPVFGAGMLRGGMLLSRFISFYLFVIVSLVVVIINASKKKDIKGEIDEQAFEFEEEIRRMNKSNIVI